MLSCRWLSLVLAWLALLAPSTAHAICDVIPQAETIFRGATGSLNRVFASPGDAIEVSLDPAGCDEGLAFDIPSVASTNFQSGTTEGWTALPGTLSGWNALPGYLVGVDTAQQRATVRAPASYHGSWVSVTGVTWSLGIENGCGGGCYLNTTDVRFLQLSGPGGSAYYQPGNGQLQNLPTNNGWGPVNVPFAAGAPPGGWTVTAGTWLGLVTNVTQVDIQIEYTSDSDESYRIDAITVQGTVGLADVATVLYDRPAGGKNAIVVAKDAATCTALAAELAACTAELGGGQVTCQASAALAFDATRFAFPLPGGGNDFAGPATIAVSPSTGPLPCELATLRCADQGAPGNLLACIDELYAQDDTCGTNPPHRHAQFPGFTALPPSNDFADLCASSPGSPCTGATPDLRLTIDAAGNAVVPMTYTRVLVPGGLPIPRLVRLVTSFEAFDVTPGVDPPVAVPGTGFLQSFSPRGHRVPPLFTPVPDATDASKILGSVDAERGVIRIPRRSERFRECRVGGTGSPLVPGVPCTADSECPGGSSCGQALCYAGGVATTTPCATDLYCTMGQECGPSLYDLADRLEPGGHLLVPASDYDAAALHPVAIDALIDTQDFVVTVRSEPLEGDDLNGDTDEIDASVVSVRDKESDSELVLGLGGATGASITRSSVYPFSVPAVAAEEGITAFLTPESSEGQLDANDDGDLFDYALTVTRKPLSGTGTPEIVSQGNTADGELLLDGKSVVVSDGLVFWRERETDRAPQFVAQQNVTAQGQPDDGTANFMRLSNDARLTSFTSSGTTVMPQAGTGALYVHDRDSDGDGILDEPGAIDTVPVGSFAASPRMSGTGRFVVFRSPNELIPGLTGNHVYIHDRDVDQDGIFDEVGQTKLVNVSTDALGIPREVSAGTQDIDVSDDGRFVVYNSSRNQLTGVQEPGAFQHIWVHDRNADQDGLFDDEGNGYQPGEIGVWRVQAGGNLPNANEDETRISGDGQWVAFRSSSTNLGTSDTNGVTDAYVARTIPGATPVLLSRRANGVQFNHATSAPLTMSHDGRFVAMQVTATNAEGCCPPASQPNQMHYPLVRDRDVDENGIFDEPLGVENVATLIPGFTEQVGVVSRDGRYANVVDGDFQLGGRFDLATRIGAPIVGMPLGGTPLGVINGLNHDAAGLGPHLLFKRPGLVLAVSPDMDASSPGNAGNDLDGDGQLDDTLLRVLDGRTSDPLPAAAVTLGAAEQAAIAGGTVAFVSPIDGALHLWHNRQMGAPDDLGQSVRDVSLSPLYVAAIEATSGNVLVSPVAGAGPGTWTDLGIPAIAVQVFEHRVGFLDEESLLYIYDAQAGTYIMGPGGEDPVGADEFILDLVITLFRVPEVIAGDLNGDGDATDSVMHVLHLETGEVFNTGYAAIPCPTEACDPSSPYKVEGTNGRFLTLETQQANSPIGCPIPGPVCDLDGNGLGTDLILQTFNAAAASAAGSAAGATDVVASTATGVCTDTGRACSGDTQCPGAECFVPPGECIRNLGSPCTPGIDGSGCAVGQICVPTSSTTGTCHVTEGPCSSDGDCTNPAFCTDSESRYQRVFSAVEGEEGSELLLGVGKCLGGPSGVCTTNEDCDPGEICHEGDCRAADTTCRTNDDCVTGYTCERRPVVAGSGDVDGDGIADALDDCPTRADPDQADTDEDGVGDACDRQTCGNGIQEYEEQCDRGSQNGSGMICDSTCVHVGPGTACSDGIDDDGDGLVDLADPGCSGGADTSERNPAASCDDGVDNDGDYGVDRGGDPGCGSPTWQREDPACSDGVDNDADGKADFDGAGLGAADPNCPNPSKLGEGACGFGAELILLAPLLHALGRRRQRR